jgi:hypothetical protein
MAYQKVTIYKWIKEFTPMEVGEKPLIRKGCAIFQK